MTDEYLTLEEIKKEAESPHVTADMLNLLVQQTKELSTLKKHDISKLEALLEHLETRLAQVEGQTE